MSPKIPSLAAAGLTALGLSWYAPFGAAQAPSEPAPSAAPAPGTLSVPPRATSPMVLLLSNGDVLRGEVSEDDRGFVVKMRLGNVRRPRREVEGAFPDLHAAYLYKAERLAKQDPDEHLALARWCLVQKLDTEAQAELSAVVDLDPGNKRAKAMLFNVQTASQRSTTKADPAVLQTSAEMSAGDGAPGVLNLGQVREQAKKTRSLGVPVVLDLPPELALPRYQEFAKYVHPQLQKACARCHNDRSTGRFQLVQVETKRDLSNELLVRANLDAALRLVNPDDLASSELLRAAIMDHPPANRPILTGPNDPTYRVFSSWVRSLKAEASGMAPRPGLALAPVGGATDAFATERGGMPAAPAPNAATSAVPPSPAMLRPSGLIPGSHSGPAMVPGQEPDFRTVSPLTDPTQAPAIRTGMPVKPGTAAPATASNGEAFVKGADGKAIPVGPDGKPIVDGSKVAPSKDRKAKTFNLDPAALGQILAKPR